MNNPISRNDRVIIQGVHLLVIISLLLSNLALPAKVSANSLANHRSGELRSGIKDLPSFTTTIDYQYDALSRLKNATDSNGQAYAYTYDKAGNRTSQTVAGVTTPYLYDAADRLTSAGGVAFSWNDNGNLLSDGFNTYSYDFANRLVSIGNPQSTISHSYDGQGNRYRQAANGLTTTYTLDQAAGLTQVLSDGVYTYTYGQGRNSQQNAAGTDYFLPDGLGSARQLANNAGKVTLGQSFDPFGSPLVRKGFDSSSYGYTGEWTDGSGLQYLRARYYSPAMGRFLSRDPFPGLQTQPATQNPYAYAANHLVLLADPSGEFIPLLITAGFIGEAGWGQPLLGCMDSR